MFMSLCVDIMVTTSAYVVSFTGASGVECQMCICLNGRCVDVLFL